jgi:hypothetical protein
VQQVDAARASHLPVLLLPYLGLGMLGLLIVGLRPPRALYLLRPSESASVSMSCRSGDRAQARPTVPPAPARGMGGLVHWRGELSFEDLVIGCPRGR